MQTCATNHVTIDGEDGPIQSDVPQSSSHPALDPCIPLTASSGHISGYLGLRFILKNVGSLFASDRLDTLTAELDMCTWDVVLLTETWRSEREDIFTLPSGHLFVGSGGATGERGVASIIHKRWSDGIRKINCVSERLIVFELDILHVQFTVMVPYFPHSGYSDTEVEPLYEQMAVALACANV